jgi:hypothetical protein
MRRAVQAQRMGRIVRVLGNSATRSRRYTEGYEEVSRFFITSTFRLPARRYSNSSTLLRMR